MKVKVPFVFIVILPTFVILAVPGVPEVTLTVGPPATVNCVIDKVLPSTSASLDNTFPPKVVSSTLVYNSSFTTGTSFTGVMLI